MIIGDVFSASMSDEEFQRDLLNETNTPKPALQTAYVSLYGIRSL